MVMKPKNSNCDKTQKLKLWWSSKTRIVMKLKNQNFDETQKLKLWCNSKTQMVIKLKKIKFWWSSKTQIVMKLKNSNCDKTQKLKLWQNLNFTKSRFIKKKIFLRGLLVKTFWHLDNWWDVLWATFCDSRNVFINFPPPSLGLKPINIDINLKQF